MLFHLFEWLSGFESSLSVFQYITLRAILATITSLLITLFFGSKVISLLTRFKLEQSIRDDGPKEHLSKNGKPTMGGILIISAIIVSTLLWADLTNIYIWIALVVTTSFATIGAIDDLLKIKHTNSQGMKASTKYMALSIIAVGAAIFLYQIADYSAQTDLLIPYVKNLVLPIGILFIPMTYFVLVGTGNAVNLTDGLDGLAILPTVIISAALAIFAYVSGHFYFSEYLLLPFIPGNDELALFCSAIVGAGLGFLWFNTYPAQVFMGDIGALGLGGAMGITAVIVRQELIFFIMAGLFVAETLSVIIQVFSYKTRGKRVFSMAPLHHHFELKGWEEPKIIVRFWIITCILVLIGLASLKIR